MTKNLKGTYGLFNDSFPPVLDGVTLTVENYVAGLRALGESVTVVTPWNPVTPPHEGYDLLRFFSLPIYNRSPYRYGYPRIDPFIWARLNRQSFKLVHAHCPFSSGRLAVHCAKRQHIPLIGTFHSKYRTDLEHSLPEWMVKKIMRRVLNFFESCDEVWIPQAQVEETVREYGFKGPLTVVENGNDFVDAVPPQQLFQVKADAKAQLGMKPGQLALLFVGQHIIPKGVDLIIEALKLLPESLDWRMDFIGTGYFAAEAAKIVQQSNLTDRVVFHGVISDRPTLMKHYAAADLFLFPSMYDNAPLVVREAAALATPAILPVNSTAAEVVTDLRNGFVIPRTAVDYAQLITRLGNDRDLVKTVGQGARNDLTRSWSDIMTEVTDRYNHLIDRYGR